ncbi:hypothetical protein LEP1GSC037_1917 [Leptospira interrogans str. 2006001854]|uniref:Uncharacterized protein n=1 Tax=Leptospira interrogans str. 2006001854 TaxID=1001590 RepID=M6GJC7_LEPIR|nr:hypothetical protein LEP1GSC037_1917 [Leptospira interrogans str. 2006001854]
MEAIRDKVEVKKSVEFRNYFSDHSHLKSYFLNRFFTDSILMITYENFVHIGKYSIRIQCLGPS